MLREKWIAALRSGEYRQCTGMLGDGKGAYCALGVLSKVSGLCMQLAYDVVGFKPYEASLVAWMNDVEHHSFNQIADALETMWKKSEDNGSRLSEVASTNSVAAPFATQPGTAV